VSRIPIVHIIDHMGLGGVQTLLRAMLPHLPVHGYAPVLISLRGETDLSRSLADSGVPVRSLDLPKWSPAQLSCLIAELRRLRPVIVHTHLTVGNLLGRIAAIIAHTPAIVMEEQVSLSQDVYGLPPLVALVGRLAEPYLGRHTARYIGPSQIVMEASRAAKGWPDDRCRVRYNAVDCARFAPVTDRRVARMNLGIPDRLTVTTLGRFVPQKRIADVVEVARRVLTQFPDVQFLIGGGGPEEGTIHAAIVAAQLGDRVLMIGRRDDSERILAASDIYLSVSAGEVLSIAILEAMACGCSVVATRAGGTAEQVIPGANGSLTAVGDLDGLTNGVLGVLRDPALREQQSRASRHLALQFFDLPTVAAAQAAIYDELCATARVISDL